MLPPWEIYFYERTPIRLWKLASSKAMLLIKYILVILIMMIIYEPVLETTEDIEHNFFTKMEYENQGEIAYVRSA